MELPAVLVVSEEDGAKWSKGIRLNIEAETQGKCRKTTRRESLCKKSIQRITSQQNE